MIPHEGSFLAGMALREAGVAALRETDLPDDLVAEIENGRVYGEGRAARIEVTDADRAALVEILLEVKLSS